MSPSAHSFSCGVLGRPGFTYRVRNHVSGVLGGLQARHPRACRSTLQVVCADKANYRRIRRPQPWREGAQKSLSETPAVPRSGRGRGRNKIQRQRSSSRGSVKQSSESKTAPSQKKRKKSQCKAPTGGDDKELLAVMEESGLTRGKSQLKVLLGIGLTYSDLSKLLASRIEVTYHKPATIVRKLKFFTEVVGMDQDELKKMIIKFPRLLEYNRAATFGPRLKYLGSLGVQNEDLPKIFLQAPAVMELSVGNSLRPRVEYLQKNLGIPEESMRTIILRHPQLLTYTVDSMTERVQFLESFGLREDKLLKSIISHPQVNMAPKVEYMCAELGGCGKTIESNPSFLALSLQNRIIPRYEFMKEKSGKAIKHPAPMAWFKCSDKVFAGKVAKVPLSEFVAFKEHMLTV